MLNTFIARQPIYDSELSLFAYELLYRVNEENSAPSDAGDKATYSVLANFLIDIGLDDLVGPHYAFINLTRGFLVGDNPMPFFGNQVVLEILEDIPPDEEVLNGIRRLSAEGHMIALDDFIYDESKVGMIELSDIVKLDLMALTEIQLREHVDVLRQYDVKLLAEKVETEQEFGLCKQLGFDYFQGYFFCRPNLLKRNKVPDSPLALTQLLSKLSDPEVNMDELNDIISCDVSLSYKFLHYVNSPFFYLPSKVESLRQTLTYLGLNLIKQLIIVLSMSGIKDKPNELIVTALVRAKMCELIADSHGGKSNERYFMVGLFSVLDALLDQPLDEILESLSLTDELNSALLKNEGDLGKVLACVVNFERGQWLDVDSCDLISGDKMQKFYLDSISWASKYYEGNGKSLISQTEPATNPHWMNGVSLSCNT